MGRDLTIYPDSATKSDLVEHLEALGFKPCSHFWDWPEGTANYSWFDGEDFKSIDGVSADVYPVSGDELSITGNKWAMHVRNQYSASWHDVHMLNHTLRGVRKKYGGTIKGDYGTNRYAPHWKDESTPLSRGISKITQHVLQELSSVKYALPNPQINHEPKSGEVLVDFIEFTNTFDPSRVIYNGLVPFAVSMFEYFFSQAFIVLITYDKQAIDKKSKHKQKVEFEDVLKIGSGALSIEEVIASKYTFQNMNQLNSAYREWLGMDVRKILYRRRKIGKKVAFLENRIAEIIEYRHGVVHRFEIDRTLTKEAFVHILEAVEKTIEEVVSHIESQYKVNVQRQ